LWLVLLALAMSVVSFYYYLKILKQTYVSEPVPEAGPIYLPATTRVAVWGAAALVVVLGCWPDLLLSRITAAVSVLR
jgi:NADH-quinone oxidoreductase subunit N